MPWPGCAEVAAWGHVAIWGGGRRAERICPRGWPGLWKGVEGLLPTAPPPPPFLPPPRLAAPLPLCCMLASARWIFLAVPILLPPVRAVLEPAKWLSFKPRAAGGAVAKPRRPPSRPSFDAAAAAWALSPFFPHAPARLLQTPPALPRPQPLTTRPQSGEEAGAFTTPRCPHPQPRVSISISLPMGFPTLLLPRAPDRRTEACTRAQTSQEAPGFTH